LRPRILLTRPWPEGAFDYLKMRYEVTVNDSGVPLSPAQLKAALHDYDALCSTVTDKLTPDVLGTGGARVGIIANFGAGYEHINLEAARAAGIRVTNTPDVLTEATADIALLLMLMTSRRAGEAERGLRGGQWNGWKPTQFMGRSLEGKTLGLIGFGRIGKAVARKAKAALNMNIAYFSRTRATPEAEAELGARYVDSIDALVAQADVVSLHTPGGAETQSLMDARRLGLMKPSAILINTARGSVVNEAELAAALKAGTLWAAGLDVYAHEPVVHPDLLGLENAVLLPHLGSATEETRNEMGMRAARNLDRFFAGEPLLDPLA